jgi:hypothetical protein
VSIKSCVSCGRRPVSSVNVAIGRARERDQVEHDHVLGAEARREDDARVPLAGALEGVERGALELREIGREGDRHAEGYGPPGGGVKE